MFIPASNSSPPAQHRNQIIIWLVLCSSIPKSSSMRSFGYRPLRLLQSDLTPVSEPIKVDATTFAEITREAKVPVLVDF